MKDYKELQKEVAVLESRIDQYETEMDKLNTLLMQCGFPSGIPSLKATINELLHEATKFSFLDEEDEDEEPPCAQYS